MNHLKKCPNCDENVHINEILCPYCNTHLRELTTTEFVDLASELLANSDNFSEIHLIGNKTNVKIKK